MTIREAGPEFATIVGLYSRLPVGNADAIQYRVQIDPDGDLVVTWPAPTPDDSKARDAAILRQDDASATNLRGLLRAIRAGEVR